MGYWNPAPADIEKACDELEAVLQRARLTLNRLHPPHPSSWVLGAAATAAAPTRVPRAGESAASARGARPRKGRAA